MNYQVKLGNFSGPFELLCYLIETAELDICSISLVQVVDQYVDYAARAKKHADLDNAGEFLVVAAKLLLLKTRVLLPVKSTPKSEQEESIMNEEAEQLVQHLRQYRRFRDLGRRLGQIMEAEADYQAINCIRCPGARVSSTMEPPLMDLEALVSALVHLKPLLTRVQTMTFRARRPTVQEEMANLTVSIKNCRCVSLESYLGPQPSLYRLATVFLALLELWRQETIAIEQKVQFGDILMICREDPVCRSNH